MLLSPKSRPLAGTIRKCDDGGVLESRHSGKIRVARSLVDATTRHSVSQQRLDFSCGGFIGQKRHEPVGIVTSTARFGGCLVRARLDARLRRVDPPFQRATSRSDRVIPERSENDVIAMILDTNVLGFPPPADWPQATTTDRSQ
jgi:hypothetical protein